MGRKEKIPHRKAQLESLRAENCKHGGHGDFYCVCEDGFHEKSIACKGGFCN